MFSSAVRIVPHGVTPPAQLFSVPRTRVPVGSDPVRMRGCPAAGPWIAIGVDPVIRRLSAEFRTTLPEIEQRRALPERVAGDRALQVVAVHGARDEVRRAVDGLAVERLVAAEDGVHHAIARVRVSQVEEARSQIVQTIRRLEESGQIIIRREGEDEYVS